MRVWIVDDANVTIRTYRVSGRMGQPDPGTYHVYSRSTFTCNIDHPNICMRFMVRFAHGPLGDNIGFHEIPKRDGVPIESDAQLGQALSGGCVRQATADATFMWDFAGIGTTVVVTD
jgi:lipoprotein-anchoring transpeptidase ErfK/SrfK